MYRWRIIKTLLKVTLFTTANMEARLHAKEYVDAQVALHGWTPTTEFLAHFFMPVSDATRDWMILVVFFLFLRFIEGGR